MSTPQVQNADHPTEGRRLSLVEAMSLARRTVAMFTELAVDAVPECAPDGAGWRVVVDVVEAPARLGDNDLIASYEVRVTEEGEVGGFQRTARYNRIDAARG